MGKYKRGKTMKKFIVIYTILILILSLLLYPSITWAESEEVIPEQLHQQIFDYDVIIDVGHGGVDGGTSYGNILEKNLNLEIGVKLFHLLRAKGYQVGITRLHDYALSDDSPFHNIHSRHRRDLRQRWLISEGLKPKLFISIHVNYSGSSSTEGPVIIHQKQAESYLLAGLLQNELNQLAQTNHSNKQSSYYYLLQNMEQPCLIAEVGYISHPGERQKLQDPSYQKKMAEHMSQAIHQFFILYP
jgi:N-acetylmuramoyl-L-alanine amidase